MSVLLVVSILIGRGARRVRRCVVPEANNNLRMFKSQTFRSYRGSQSQDLTDLLIFVLDRLLELFREGRGKIAFTVQR